VLDTIKQLDEYFKGIRKILNLKLALQGTPFQRKVYISLLNIPYGKTMSYKDIAAMVKDPKAARAVGSANNKNNILIAIPCHRVTRKDGKLSGTKEWQQKQQWLINFEKSNS
jgi:methylated-DNA-[protein]-cysteine S-methyltransferase